MNIASVFRFLAYIMLFVALILLVPAVMAVYYGEPESLRAFMMTMAIMLLFSLLCIFLTRKQKELRIGARESMLIVTLTWVIMTAFGALPIYFTDSMRSYAACYFEIMCRC